MSNKKYCKLDYDNGTPLSDDYWYYTTRFECRRSMTEISTYRRPNLKTFHFNYCPYCGKPIEK